MPDLPPTDRSLPDRPVLIVTGGLLAGFMILGLFLLIGVKAGGDTHSEQLTADIQRLENTVRELSQDVSTLQAQHQDIRILRAEMDELKTRSQPRNLSVLTISSLTGWAKRRNSHGVWFTIDAGQSFGFNVGDCILVGPDSLLSWRDERGNSGILRAGERWRTDSRDCNEL